MRAEEMRVRRRHDPGGRGGLARQIVARLSHGLAVRGQLLRFALAGSSNDRWGRFRGAARPQIVWWRFCLAFLPLAGRLPVQNFLRVRRRPWDEPSQWLGRD
jgi:hypothetical protein